MALIAAPNNKSSLKHRAGNTSDIIAEVIQCYKDSNQQVARYAPKLKAGTLLKTCNNVWAAVKDNINYKIDPPGVQWVRTPARLWRDKEGDCKSFSVFIGSCLHQLQIPFVLRFVSFSHTDKTPTHVYVVVLTGDGEEIILDAVLPSFNEQKPFTYKKDFKMPTEIARLSGVGAVTAQDAARALAIEYQLRKRMGKVNELITDQYNFYYNALLQKPVAVSGSEYQGSDIFSGLVNSYKGISSGDFSGLANQGYDNAANTLNELLPGSGALLQSIKKLFGGSDPLKDYEGWDAQDIAAGRPKGSSVRGYVWDNGGDVVREAKNVASYIQKFGLDILTSGAPPATAGGSKTAQGTWANVTIAQIADKLQRGGLTTQAQQLFNLGRYQTTNNTGGNAGTNSGTTNDPFFNTDGNGGNTGGGNSNLLLYAGIAVAAYLLLKK